MAIRKKSKEELQNQVEGFLDYEERNGKITEEKKKEILEILKGEDLKTKKVDEIKNNLLSVLSPDEFDGLYGRYLEFPKKNRKELKEFILELGIVPQGYEFLVNVLLKPIGYYVTVENLKNEGVQEMVEEFKTKLKDYIEFLENDLGIPKNELSKNFKEFDLDFDIVKARNNLEVLNSLGITDKEDIIQFFDVIVNRRTEKLKENIEAIKSTGFTSKEDFVKLCKIVSSVAETDEIKANIEALQSAGITSAEDIGELGDVIIYGRYAEKIKANIEILKSMGITSIKDIGKLNFIINFGDPEKIKANIEALQSVGITSIEDIGGLYGLVNYGDAEKIKANIEALQSMGITSVKEIGELYNIVSGWPTENIYTLNKVLGIESFKDFKKFLIFWDYLSESSSKKINENIHVLIDNKIISKQELIDNISELRWIVENGEKLNFKTLAGICTGNIENLKKLSPVIQNSHAASISAFVNDAGITNIDDLLRLEHENLFAGDPTIIRAFIKAGMKSVDDFIILKEKMSSLSLHEKKAAENIQAFYDAGIRKPEDFVFLSDLIRGYDTRTDLIKAFHEAGINKAEDFWKLAFLIGNYKIDAGMISLFSKAGIKSADEFYLLEMNNVLENAKIESLERLSSAGIKSIDELLRLRKLCTSPDTPLIFDELNYASISDENLIEILEIISNELSYQQFCLFTFLDKLKDKIPVNSYDELCGLKELYNELCGKYSYSYQLDLKILLFYHKGFSIEEIGEAIEHDFFPAKYENLKVVFEKYPNIGIEKLKNLKEVLTYAKPENIRMICEKYPKLIAERLKNLEGILTYVKPENIRMICEKYPDIEIVKLKTLKEFLTYVKPENLKIIFEKYPDIEIVKLKKLEEFLSSATPENLKIVFEEYEKQGKKLSINDLKKLDILLRSINPKSLKILFNKYEGIQIDELSEIKDNFRASDSANIELLFNYFNGLELIELIESKILTFQGALPKDMTFKEENHKGYLKDLVEIANMGYGSSKKINMMKKLCSLTFPQAKNYIEIFKIFDESISMDIQRIKDELIEEILNADNPKDIADQINGIFERNNLPLTGKVFKVFELLYPKEKLDYELKPDSGYGTLGSPVLNSFREGGKLKEGRGIYDLIYKDLMNIAIKSGDRSLREYLKVFIGSEELLGKFEEIIKKEGFNPDDNLCLEGKLDEEKQAQLLYLFRRISVLYDRYYGKQINEGNSIEDKKYGDSTVADNQLVKLYNDIKKGFRLKKGESLYDRLQRFLWGLGYHSFKEVLDKMDESKRQAHERGLKLYNEAVGGKINFPNHAFLKGVDEDAFSKIINRGITSREYLGGGDDGKDSWNEGGNGAGSDCTPFDIDGYYVDKQAESSYGLVNLVVNTDRGDFVNTTIDENPNGLSGYNENQYELFKTGGGTHYGIRTGIPTTEIDYIIYRGSFNRTEKTLVPTEEHPEGEYIETFSKFQNMCYEIARNGYYIPIVDEEGNIKFTPEMYHKIRSGFNYMEYYDGYDVELKDGKYIFRISDNTVNKTYNGDNEKIKDSELSALISENSPKNERYQKFAEENRKLAKKTIEWIKKILEDKCGIKFNNLNDSSITGAEIHDTGSTGRGTDIPTKDVDLDFTLLLDAKDYERIDEIKRIIHEEIGTQNDNDHDVGELGNQIKSKINNIGKSDERKNGVPLDLLILKKSQIIDYSSSDAMKEKLDYIESIPQTGSDDLERVRTNVIIMKKLLKAKSCYKHPEGGFAGIGVENWITQHHGSFIEALESFEEVAYGGKYEEGKTPLPLEDFKEKYPMYDAGENYKLGCNDNFVYQIDKHGGDTAYQKILQIVKFLRLEGIDGIRKIIKEYEDKKSEFIE